MRDRDNATMSLDESKKIWKELGEFLLPTNEFIKPVLKRGAGSFVWDVDGNKYLDLNGGQFCLCFGHGYDPFIKAVARQLNKIVHTDTNVITDIVFEALQRLTEITARTFKAGILLSTGAEAVEFALRFSKSIKKKEKIIFLNQGYHGLSLGAQSVSTYGKWAVPKITGTFGVSVPKTSAEVGSCIGEIRRILKENPGGIAALIMEPILGAGGMIYPPLLFFKEIRALCNENGVILIFDESQTGFGRTGYWFCYQKYNVSPDVLIFAKAGGAGLPVSGVLFSEGLAEEMRHGDQTHFSSHQNDPLSAAILLFVMEEIKSKNMLARVKKFGQIFLNELVEVASKSRALVNPRGVGLMLAFDLKEELFADGKNPGYELIKKLLSRGVIIQCIDRGRTFRVMPNFLISFGEINFFIKGLRESLKEISYE